MVYNFNALKVKNFIFNRKVRVFSCIHFFLLLLYCYSYCVDVARSFVRRIISERTSTMCYITLLDWNKLWKSTGFVYDGAEHIFNVSACVLPLSQLLLLLLASLFSFSLFIFQQIQNKELEENQRENAKERETLRANNETSLFFIVEIVAC